MAFIKILKCPKFTGSFVSFTIGRTVHKISHPCRIVYKMKTAYFYNVEGEEKVFITVKFSEMDINSTFSFERNIREPLEIFLKRLTAKLESSCAKKFAVKKQKKKVIESQQQFNFTPMLLLNNEEISDNLLFEDIFHRDFNGTLKLRILESDYDVVLNSPLVNRLSLPKVLQVGGIVSPKLSDVKFTDIEKSDFVWYKSLTPNKLKSWTKCGDGFFYKIGDDDLNYSLRLSCTPKTDEKTGPTVEVVSSTAVRTSENFAEIIERHKFTKEKTNVDEFRIVSYNILADMYVNSKEGKNQIFAFCNPSLLDFDYRNNLLEFEILGYNADILCFQEFERKFYNCNHHLFNMTGYECVFFEKDGTREGCGLLYDRKKFNVLQAKQYAFTRELFKNPLFSEINSKIQENEELTLRLGNVLSQIQVVVLECVDDNVLVIGNVHFYFHPNADHIRLLQGIISLKILMQTADSIKEMNQNRKVSIVLCGDFNSTPECGVHQLLHEGSVDSNHIDWKSKEGEVIKDVSFSHSLKFKSSYDNKRFTNYVPSFKGCLDYIYYQTDHLQLKQTVPIPNEEILSREEGIPSTFFPSDHVALIADFKFKNEKQ